MELVNKFDNALSGVAGDEGSTGYSSTAPTRSRPVALADADLPAERRRGARQGPGQLGPGGLADIPAQDALFGAVAQVSGVNLPAVPLYPAKHHCNTLGLTELGDLHDPRTGQAQDALRPGPHEREGAQGLARPDRLDELQRGHVQPLLVDPGRLPAHLRAEGLHRAVRRGQHRLRREVEAPADLGQPGTYWGFGFGADINGLGAQGDPRPNAANDRPVTYPFTSLGGVKVNVRSAANASTTSTRTASPTTASTSTGCRT